MVFRVRWRVTNGLSIMVPFPIRDGHSGQSPDHSASCSSCGSQISLLSLPARGRMELITPVLPSPWGLFLTLCLIPPRLCHWEDGPKILLCLSLCRIHLEDLSQSVLLHMTEKLGYKNSDVINTVLSNRASHTLAIYFLLNKKLERYLASLRKAEGQDSICHKNQLYQIEKYKANKDSYEDKKLKEQEKKGEILHRQLPKKTEKSPVSYRQPSSCLISQIQNTKALLKDRKVTKAGGPEKDSCGGVSPFHEPLASKMGCVTSSSLEYLEVQQPPPRTPRLLKRQESPQPEPSRIGGRAKDSPLILNIVHSFESVDREDQIDQVSPSHQYRILGSPMNFPYKSSSERTLSPLFPPGSTSPVHPTQVSFTYEEKAYPAKEEAVSPTQLVPSNPLGSPNCVKSRGRFPMMGIGQMLRKRNQTMQSASEKPLEARMPQLQQMSPTQISFNTEVVSGQC
ncbi:hormonally up-regulated neu tumor-associated kinase-like isoform X1 [Corvus kubaryi]|uniref:hormonally up-regulated neu tumor-associated kinase-like isoform X1 n=1 Tax=Corvus kubaryi TaxID=68294 RepID=UPI001C03DDAC|nr:hormonally up-regulated neu tumor-associated kinase-like isoform X1 [Corvus kubaryi]